VRKGKTYSAFATQYILNRLPRDTRIAARSIGIDVVDDKTDVEGKSAD
jgi:hypothetical protein